jgi:hypothetical protein
MWRYRYRSAAINDHDVKGRLSVSRHSLSLFFGFRTISPKGTPQIQRLYNRARGEEQITLTLTWARTSISSAPRPLRLSDGAGRNGTLRDLRRRPTRCPSCLASTGLRSLASTSPNPGRTFPLPSDLCQTARSRDSVTPQTSVGHVQGQDPRPLDLCVLDHLGVGAHPRNEEECRDGTRIGSQGQGVGGKDDGLGACGPAAYFGSTGESRNRIHNILLA